MLSDDKKLLDFAIEMKLRENTASNSMFSGI